MKLRLDGLDAADRDLLLRRSSCCWSGMARVGIRLAGRQSARRHPALRDDARRPAVRVAARQRLYPSRLAGADRPQPVVGSRSLRGLRRSACSATFEGKSLERPRAGDRSDRTRNSTNVEERNYATAIY